MISVVPGTFSEGLRTKVLPRVHPQGDYCGEVLGGDTGNNTEGLAEGVNVDASGSTLDGLALGERAERAGVLDALVASEHITGSVNK